MHVWGHFKTITKHKWMVMRYCFKIGLLKQGLLHDLSKYSWTEFSVGCRYFQGNRSPNNAEREEIGLSTSWLHHYGRNKHHYEYWLDYSTNSDTVIAGAVMPRKYIAEMVMDRISASRTYSPGTYNDQSPLEYYLRGKAKLWFVHKNTKQDLEMLLRKLSTDGEKELLHYIKYVYLREGKEKHGICKENGPFRS